jgi:colanic acid biosynthesis protein WcaH
MQEHWIPTEIYASIVRHMPMPTVDVVLFSSDARRVLLFLRRNPPVQGEWYTIGGRQRKGETVRECAVRQGREEAGLTLDPERLFFGTVLDEMFDDSRIPGVGAHCVNVCWGYLLEDGAEIVLDDQHERCEWFAADDPGLHPLIRRKVDSLLDEARRLFRTHLGE